MKYLIVLGLIFSLSISTHAGTYPPRSPVPSILIEPALEAARKQFPDQQQERLAFIDGFCSAILDHLRYGSKIENITVTSSDKAWSLGRKEGLGAYKNLSDAGTFVSPTDFGYTIQTLTGTYKPGFETTHFAVKGTGECFYIHRRFVESVPSDRDVTVTAYVSPESIRGFGHFGQRKKEIIVIKVEDPKLAPSVSPPAAQEMRRP